MNGTAKKLREAAACIKNYGVASAMAIARVRDALGVGKTDAISRDLGAVLDTIADELDELQARAAGANNLRQRLESAEDKVERRKKHIGYLETALHDKNALLEQRGGTIARLTAECSELRKQAPSERERQILDMWPKFEDGELVMPGDKVHYASAYNDETEIEVESITTMDGCFVLCDDGCRSNQYEHGQRVKRPVQSVLDADGVEIKVGDTVWHEDGSEQLVEELNRYGARCFDGDKRRTFNPKYLTHTRPAPKVLDADGAEIKLGDTVWHCIGIYDEMVVEEIDDESGWVRTRSANGACLSAYHTHLTHTRHDSWELLEEDASKDACMYFGTKYFNCGECPADGANCLGRMKSDLIRRAKALAGVGVD